MCKDITKKSFAHSREKRPRLHCVLPRKLSNNNFAFQMKHVNNNPKITFEIKLELAPLDTTHLYNVSRGISQILGSPLVESFGSKRPVQFPGRTRFNYRSRPASIFAPLRDRIARRGYDSPIIYICREIAGSRAPERVGGRPDRRFATFWNSQSRCPIRADSVTPRSTRGHATEASRSELSWAEPMLRGRVPVCRRKCTVTVHTSILPLPLEATQSPNGDGTCLDHPAEWYANINFVSGSRASCSRVCLVEQKLLRNRIILVPSAFDAFSLALSCGKIQGFMRVVLFFKYNIWKFM